jgi:hypothetical protein
LKAAAPVQRLLPDGTWESGWLIRDAANPHAITIEKIGNPMLLIRNMRWEIDLRAAASPFDSSQASTPSEATQSPSEALTEPVEMLDNSDDPFYGF